MGILRIHTDPDHSASLPGELFQPVSVGGQFRRADEGEVERVEEEEGVAVLGGKGRVQENIGEGEGGDFAVLDGFGGEIWCHPLD